MASVSRSKMHPLPSVKVLVIYTFHRHTSVHRRKRFVGWVFAAIVVCILFCPPRGSDPVINQRPVITCPTIQTKYYAPSRRKSVVVTWPEPTATDLEQGALTPQREFGLPSGSSFVQGEKSIVYSATDDHGNKDTCFILFEVNVIRCTLPGYLVNGRMSCTPYHYDPILGTTCSFSCNEGYERSGSATRTCQNNENFDGTVAECSKIKCPDLENPQHGEKYCSGDTYYNSVCGTSCSGDGYESEGGFINCQSDETWTSSLPSCKDKRAPYFTFCPVSPVRVYADKGKTSAKVYWNQPTAYDNSGDINITQTIGLTPGSDFGVGEHSISYVARDPSENESPVSCSFKVVVEYLECDSPDGKFDDPLISTGCPGTEYTYGTICDVFCIRNYDIIGNTTITCEREGPDSTEMVWDWGGGDQPTCDNKCPTIQPPANGAFVCQTAGNEYCRLSCNAEFGYPSGTSKTTQFVCTDQQLWDPPEADACTERRPPDVNTIGAELHYFVGDCNDAAVQSDLKDKFLAYMIDLVNGGWSNRCPNDTGCTRNTIKVVCGPVTSRRRRETIGLTTSRGRPTEPNVWSAPFREKRASDNSHVITIEFKVEITWEGGTSASDLEANDQDLYDMINAIKTEITNGGGSLSLGDVIPAMIVADTYPYMECPFGQTAIYDGDIPNCEGCATGKYYEAANSTCTKCPVGTYQNESHQTSCKRCPSDMSTKEPGRKNISECFPVCAAGSYSKTGVIPCTTCSVGEYQSNGNSKSCSRCEVGKTTIERGQISSIACLSFDAVLSSAGNSMTFPHLTTTLEEFTLMFWLHCPSGNVILPSFGFANGSIYTEMLILDVQTLKLFGATIQIVTEGWVHYAIKWTNTTNQAILLINGITSSVVPVTTRNIAVTGSYLTMTQGNGTEGGCRVSGLQMTNTSRTDADIQADASTCSPNTDHSFYNINNFINQAGIDIETPSKCDEVDECAASPCGDHFCENLLNAYKCSCKSGYTGHNCENAPNFCVSNQCEHGATCVNEAWNYTCVCPADFKGALCEDEIVNGNWAEWGEYDQCSKSCNGGLQTRIRTCSNPSPGLDGANCSGSDQDQASCNTDPCPECDPVGILLLQSRKTEKDFCITDGDYTRCHIKCQTGMEFVNQPLDYYECGANTSYNWNGLPPSCAELIPGRRLTFRTSVTYNNALPCGSETNQALETVAGEAQCIRNNECTSSVSTTGCSSRRRRDTTTTAEISFFINLDDLEDFNLTALLEHNIVSADLQTYINALTELEETAQEINNTAADYFAVKVNNVTYNIDPSTFTMNAVITCPNGSIANDGACVKCPSGTSERNGWCVFCDKGTHQNEEGQTECLACPTGYTTQFVGTTDVANCSVEATSTTSTTTDKTLSSSIAINETTTTTNSATTTTIPKTTTTIPITTTIPTTATTIPTTTTTIPTTSTIIQAITTTIPTTSTRPTTATAPSTTTTTAPSVSLTTSSAASATTMSASQGTSSKNDRSPGNDKASFSEDCLWWRMVNDTISNTIMLAFT
ncbi:Sushi, von Willebrand factor type A, EGF and pentraxin domain-containing protein 1 [Mizuhopecten yessoensis]|uniref:Sushi, von Willebrand factor type A, EGF and pentraxin domain-containing protein 1 n=1 Tax=Mizuhopecten yessoensis TaxID=6573 RepID=A0A210PZJ2_MIZYE|nr:Sushi, von Willebrand factor type A, EGF and pentraxin domain-containing protein 1 [Mizuhopecten yessoensis]